MKLTYILVLLCIIGYVFPLLISPDIEYFYNAYGSSKDNIISSPYVLFTSIFMHGSLEHLLSNIFVLLFFGLAVESELGWRKTLSIFFLGSFAGDILSALFYPPAMIGIGASAGIFALIGIGTLIRHVDMSFYPMFVPMPLALLGLAYAAYNAIFFILGIDPEVSYIAHFGGLVVGLLFGMRRKEVDRNILLTLVAIMILMLVPIIFYLIR